MEWIFKFYQAVNWGSSHISKGGKKRIATSVLNA